MLVTVRETKERNDGGGERAREAVREREHTSKQIESSDDENRGKRKGRKAEENKRSTPLQTASTAGVDRL